MQVFWQPIWEIRETHTVLKYQNEVRGINPPLQQIFK